MESAVPIFIGVMTLTTYVIELWSGIAVAGWSGDRMLVHREKSPGPYWVVMAVQALGIFGIPLLILTMR